MAHNLSSYGILLLYSQTFPLLIPILFQGIVEDLAKMRRAVEKVEAEFEPKFAAMRRAEEIARRGKVVPLSPAERDEMAFCLKKALGADIRSP